MFNSDLCLCVNLMCVFFVFRRRVVVLLFQFQLYSALSLNFISLCLKIRINQQKQHKYLEKNI